MGQHRPKQVGQHERNVHREYNLHELNDVFAGMFRVSPKIEGVNLVSLYALLMRSYTFWKYGATSKDRLFNEDTQKNGRLLIIPKFREGFADHVIIEAYKKIEESSDFSGFKLESILLQLTYLSDVVR